MEKGRDVGCEGAEVGEEGVDEKRIRGDADFVDDSEGDAGGTDHKGGEDLV